MKLINVGEFTIKASLVEGYKNEKILGMDKWRRITLILKDGKNISKEFYQNDDFDDLIEEINDALRSSDE